MRPKNIKFENGVSRKEVKMVFKNGMCKCVAFDKSMSISSAYTFRDIFNSQNDDKLLLVDDVNKTKLSSLNIKHCLVNDSFKNVMMIHIEAIVIREHQYTLWEMDSSF